MYRTFSEAKVAYLRSKGIPALAYLYDSWMGNFQATRNPHGKWLAAADAIHLAMLVSFMHGYFLVSQEMPPETDTDTAVPWHAA